VENAELIGKAKRVRIYVSEGDLHGHQPMSTAVLGFLRGEGASGATVLRAIEGFGASGTIRTIQFADIASHLPIVIDWVDRSDVVERLLPALKRIVKRGLITVDETEVVLYCGYPVHDVPPSLRVGDVMSSKVVTVTANTPVREVVELLVGKSYRTLPVVEAGKPIGIITNTDLIRRGGLAVPMQLLGTLDATELYLELERIARAAKSAAAVMTPMPVTVLATAPLTHVAEIMAHRRLKRLPVVDGDGALVGMVSRFDVLRTATRTFPLHEGQAPRIALAGDARIDSIMRTDAPTLAPDAHLPEIVQAVIATRGHRCLVVDHDRHVLGVISDAEVLERITPGLRPSALRALIHRLPFGHRSPHEREAEQHARAHVAAQLMVEVTTVSESAPIREAIAAALDGKRKMVAVVDTDRRLVGIIDRADLLRGLVAQASL
jgi:CBS domain-containing protein